MIYRKVYFCTLTMENIYKQLPGFPKPFRLTGSGPESNVPFTGIFPEMQILKQLK